MAELVNGQIKLSSGRLIPPQEGAWYEARRYLGGQLLAPGEYEPGKMTSEEVIRQTNPANVAYVQQQRQKYQATTPTAPTVPATPATQLNGQAGVGVAANLQQPTIDLPSIYKNLYAQSGIENFEKELSEKTRAYNEAQRKINDNPFLSEATRVGRLQKLTLDFNNATANLRNDIAVKKADIETQLNLQTKQFDINSEQAKYAFQQFNSLLEAGALNNASGEDIANITRSTGISSSMIYSAIQAQRDKNVQTTIKEYDDGVNQGFVVIDSKTGAVINKQVITPSKPTGGGLTATQTRDVISQARNALQTVDEQYRTKNGKLEKQDKKDYGGDMLISAQEYLKAVEMVMTNTGISKEEAAKYVSQAMTDMGYKNWSPKK